MTSAPCALRGTLGGRIFSQLICIVITKHPEMNLFLPLLLLLLNRAGVATRVTNTAHTRHSYIAAVRAHRLEQHFTIWLYSGTKGSHCSKGTTSAALLSFGRDYCGGRIASAQSIPSGLPYCVGLQRVRLTRRGVVSGETMHIKWGTQMTTDLDGAA